MKHFKIYEDILYKITKKGKLALCITGLSLSLASCSSDEQKINDDDYVIVYDGMTQVRNEDVELIRNNNKLNVVVISINGNLICKLGYFQMVEDKLLLNNVKNKDVSNLSDLYNEKDDVEIFYCDASEIFEPWVLVDGKVPYKVIQNIDHPVYHYSVSGNDVAEENINGFYLADKNGCAMTTNACFTKLDMNNIEVVIEKSSHNKTLSKKY